MSSLEEVEAAIEGARSASHLPVAVTLSFDTAGRTMMGVTGRAVAERLGPLGLAAIGANCGNNLADTEAAVIAIREGAPDVPVICKANAGIPVFKGEHLHYTGTPEVMGAHLARLRAAGIHIIGGCCGTSTEHIAYMRAVLDGTIVPPQLDAPDHPARTEPQRPERERRRRRA